MTHDPTNGAPHRIARLVAASVAIGLAGLGAFKFAATALLPAFRQLATGDFTMAFPTAYFAKLRPDFPVANAFPGWNYGPILHFLTLPLLWLPRWSLVAPVWTVVNLAVVVASFALTIRLSETAGRVSWATIVGLAGLWLLFLPLRNCFAQGNIELVEMAITLAALVALARSREHAAGVLMGVAAMTKYLPAGFVAWFLLRGKRTAFKDALITVAIIAAVASVTLKWQDAVTFKMRDVHFKHSAPYGVPQDLSINGLFLHLAGVLDGGDLLVRWFPPARATAAAHAGEVASVLLGAGYGLLLFRRRRRPISALEVSVLFMTMFMILLWNHEYYYVFSLIPFSVLALTSLVERRWVCLALASAAYLMISPPVPFDLIDRTRLLNAPFAYAVNYANVPIAGALLLWLLVTYAMLTESTGSGVVDAGAVRRRRVLAAAGAAALILVPLLCGAIYFLLTVPPSVPGVYAEMELGSDVWLSALPPIDGPAGAWPGAPALTAGNLDSLFVVGPRGADLGPSLASARLHAFIVDARDRRVGSNDVTIPITPRRVASNIYQVRFAPIGWGEENLTYSLYQQARAQYAPSALTVWAQLDVDHPAIGPRRLRVGPR